MAKNPQDPPPPKERNKEEKTKNIDPRTHRRILRFISAAEKPEDLMVAPHDRKFVDEEEAHTDHIEHHQEEEQILDREQAKQILDARDQVNPLRGFAHVRDVAAIGVFANLFDRFLTSFGPANYGRWDLLYPLNPGGTPFAIEHAALLRTYKVVFIADSTDTALWDPSDETTPIMSRLTSADTGLTANLVCCGHSFLLALPQKSEISVGYVSTTCGSGWVRGQTCVFPIDFESQWSTHPLPQVVLTIHQ